MTGIGRSCFSCGREATEDAVELESVLVPRSAARGGPVYLYRCPGCGIANLVERNPAGEILLSPPHLAGLRSRSGRGEARYAARRWEAKHRRDRLEFLARRVPEERVGGRPLPEAASPRREVEQGGEREDPPEVEADPGIEEARTVLEAYEVLGLPLHARPREIRRRYRELSKRCHPDRVADMDEEIRRVAERRFRRLKRAYDLLMGE